MLLPEDWAEVRVIRKETRRRRERREKRGRLCRLEETGMENIFEVELIMNLAILKLNNV